MHPGYQYVLVNLSNIQLTPRLLHILHLPYSYPTTSRYCTSTPPTSPLLHLLYLTAPISPYYLFYISPTTTPHILSIQPILSPYYIPFNLYLSSLYLIYALHINSTFIFSSAFYGCIFIPEINIRFNPRGLIFYYSCVD